MKEKNKQNELKTKEAERILEGLTLSDNFIFCKVMMNKELCRKILSEILGEEVSRVEYPQYEKVVQARYDAKSIRLDVYLRDGDETVYNVEMQNINNDCIPKRGRYYQDLIDLDLLEKGAYYSELNKGIVIFICTFDLYNLDLYKYTFTNQCKEIANLEYGDETTKIIVNSKGTKGEVSEDFKVFLKAVNGQFSNSEFSDKIKVEIERVKQSKDVRREFMALYLHDEDIRRAGILQGISEGIFDLLNDLGEIPEDVKARIESENNHGVLREWLKAAAKVTTMEEFRKKIGLTNE